MSKSQVTVRLDREHLAKARKALGTQTVTETIEAALALATEKGKHDSVIRKYSGVGRKDSFVER